MGLQKKIPVYSLEHFAGDCVHLAPHAAATAQEHMLFGVYNRAQSPCKHHIDGSRRNFYKITLTTRGEGVLKLGGRQYAVRPDTLVFLHPSQVEEWEASTPEQDGYYCIFPERFFSGQTEQRFLKSYPLLQLGAGSVLPLTARQAAGIRAVFEQMMQVFDTVSPNKWNILKHYLHILMLEAEGYAAPAPATAPADATWQLARRFLELLEQQFPIQDARQQVQLRKAGHFAKALHVHTNYLNHAVRTVTGYTVSDHINNRLVQETQTLLLYTDWPVSSIAFCLGFEEVASFTHFVKKHTGSTPVRLRRGQSVV